MSQLSERLPTADQVRALTDRGAVGALKDDVEKAIARMETDLEFRSDGDAGWEAKARSALALHRYIDILLGRRLAQLDRRSRSTASTERPAEECHPLTMEVIRGRPEIHVPGIDTTAEIDERFAWLSERIAAMEGDRSDEIGLVSAERDESFLSLTGRLLAHMRLLRVTLQNRRGVLSRAERRADFEVREQTRERQFIDLMRERLTREEFLAAWAKVDEMEAARGPPL